ncbi:MAG: AraC family transcriptional regulator [Chitinophagaceae bacterium]|nr:MAG: AraC family transcriptional regulator [Chitinophagaceae bacterium]
MRLTVPDKKILLQIAARINSDLSQNHTIPELAAMAGMSASRFKTGFHLLFGEPVHRYTMHKQMELAYELIQQDEHTLAQIASLCGYRHTTNFIKAFKKRYGITPGRAKPR